MPAGSKRTAANETLRVIMCWEHPQNNGTIICLVKKNHKLLNFACFFLRMEIFVLQIRDERRILLRVSITVIPLDF